MANKKSKTNVLKKNIIYSSAAIGVATVSGTSAQTIDDALKKQINQVKNMSKKRIIRL